jgi:hypothetical protein
MKLIIFFLPFLCWLPNAGAQLPGACGGGSSPAIACNTACINCNFNGFNGSTAGFPSGIAPEFCGTVENAQWLGFIAGGTQATFTITPSNCADGNGVQVALYTDCTLPPVACDKGEKDGGMLPVSISTPLSPGGNYFLLIDGYAGDQCDFSVSVSPANAVYEPPLGDIQSVNGPTKLCPGAQFPFSVPPVFGAGGYIWTGPPGTLFDSIPSPATIVGSEARTVLVTMGNQSGNICVQAANACSQTTPCASSIYVEVLDDSFLPKIVADTVQHLNCSESDLVLEIKMIPTANYVYSWSADSIGNIGNQIKELSPKVNKTGTYTVKATNAVNGCAAQTSIRVAEPDYPSTVDLNIQDVSCTGYGDGSLGVRKIMGGKAPFLYAIDGDDWTNTPVFSFLDPGDHHIRIQGDNGCEWDSTFAISEPDLLKLDLGLDTSIHLGDRLVLWNISDLNDPARFHKLTIEPAYLSESACDTCYLTPLNSIRYAITVFDSNGCKASDERVVAVDKGRRVFIPNIFKPDAPDGNQQFRIFGGEDVVQIKMFRVLNRWGQVVYESKNFLPNDLNAVWDGKVAGEKVPPDVFLYFAEIQFKDGETELFKGDVTLMR